MVRSVSAALKLPIVSGKKSATRSAPLAPISLALEVLFAVLVRGQIVGNLVVEDDIEEGAVHAQSAIVINET